MTYKTKNFSRHSNVLYIKGNIVKDLERYLSSSTRAGYDLLLPQCFSSNINHTNRLTQQIYSLYPDVKTNTEIFLSNTKNYGHTQLIELHNKTNKNLNKVFIANMFCNRSINTKRKIDYISLAKCMSEISVWVRQRTQQKENDKIQIISSKFGTGFNGGNWSFIEQMINDAWSGITTTIYNYDYDTSTN